MVEDRCGILWSLVIALLLPSSRIVESEEKPDQLFVGNHSVVKSEVEDFDMGGRLGANLSVGGVLRSIGVWTHEADRVAQDGTWVLGSKHVDDVLFCAPVAAGTESSQLFTRSSSHLEFASGVLINQSLVLPFIVLRYFFASLREAATHQVV